MGWDAASLPPAVRRLMPASEPHSIAAQEQRRAVTEHEAEADMHDQFATWLRYHAAVVPVPHVHSRMDRKSTIREGWPDFTVTWNGRVAFVEFKMPGNKLSQAQHDVARELVQAGMQVAVCHTVAEAIAYAKKFLEI
jgi:hypothetical protein